MITDKEFLQEQNEDEIFSVIESFLNRWKEKFKEEHPETPEQILYNYLPIDKDKLQIIKQMIKDFKRYKN
jgi:hypothetical protein